MKTKLLSIGAVIASVVVSIQLFAPEKLEPAKSIFRSAKVNKCLDLWRSRFDDPESLIFVSSYERHENGWHRLTIRYRAKNMFGAWVSSYLSCGLDGAEEISLSETFKYQDNPNYGLVGNGPDDYPAPAPAPAPR